MRVIVVDMMVDGADFIDCFNILCDNYKVNEDDTFTIVTRIFRGGGFTKDHLYLSGFVEILKFYKSDNDIRPLFVWKTSIDFYNTIEEMMGRGMVEVPKFIPDNFINSKGEKNNELYNYIFKGLK